jgi:GWxTD domain-containing protein
MPPCRIATLVLLALLPPLAAADAQSNAQRVALERFRDSLDAMTEPAPLRELESDLIAEARRDRDNPILHLRLGFVAIRLGEVVADSDRGEARRHFDEAAGEFEWATQVKPDWPYGWYGLGVAELGLGDSEVTLVQGLQTMMGRDALTRSATAFARSAEVDPGFVAGLVELSNTALKQRINARMDVALAALRRASRTSSADAPSVLLARGRVERVAGSLDSSAAVLTRVLDRDSTNSVARYELARTRFLQGDGGATALWYQALSEADSATLSLFREDLAVILPDSMLVTFDAAAADARVRLVRDFWSHRDDDDLHRRGSRVAEHYRRLDVARRSYRLVSENRHYGIAERYRSDQSEYDDRGIIYIRHGAPDEQAQYNAPGIEPNESWIYRREGQDLVFHFVARQDVQDYRLVESLFDVLDYASTVAMRDLERNSNDPATESLRRHIEGLLLSREPFDPLYSRLLGAGRSGSAQLLTEERAAGRRSIDLGTSTDSWPLDLGDEIEAHLRVLAVGSDAGGPQLQVAFAIPGHELLAREVDGGGFAYPVRIRASVMSLDGTTVARADTTRSFLSPEPIGDHQVLLGRLPVNVPPGLLTVRVALQTDLGGLVTRREEVRVASPLGPEVGLSDLALGARSVYLPWLVPGGDTAWVNPLARYDRREPAQLYFEVTGLPPGTRYSLELTLRREGGGSILRRIFGGGSALKLESEDVHPGGIDRVSRELSFDQVSPGRYVIEVKVRTEDGREVVRRRDLEIVE